MLNQNHFQPWQFWRKRPHRVSLTGILWPSLGHPSILEPNGGETLLTVLLALPESAAPAPARFHARLLPIAGGADPIVLTTLAAERVPLAGVHGIGRWPAWVLDGAPSVLRLQLALPATPLNQRTSLFDLEVRTSGQLYQKPGAVALHQPGAGFRILLATDLHLASRWDEVEQGLAETHAASHSTHPDPAQFTTSEAFARRTVLNSYVNPNRNLAAFLQIVNQLAAAGQADAVILSGDLVDYKFNRHRAHSGGAFADTGWKLLHDTILGAAGNGTRLRLPLFTSTGNHDYRLYPYRLRTYGLRHAGLPDEVTEPFLRARGEWGALKYATGDLDAVRIDSGPAHSLDYYFREFNPCLDYEIAISGARFLVLDSGPDAITDLSHFRTRRRLRFARGLRNLASPYSSGFDDTQIAYLRRWFQQTGQRTAVVISHAPLIFPPDQSTPLLTVPPNPNSCPGRFEQMLTDKGLDRRSLIGNQLPVFQALRDHPGPALFFAGHCHAEADMVLDRQTSQLHHAHAAPPAALPPARLYHTPSLGHGHPAFRAIHLRHGAVESADLFPLLTDGADEWIYEWTRTPGGPGSELFDFTFRRLGNAAPPPGLRRRLILRFAGAPVASMSVSAADPSAVAASHLHLNHPRHPYALWLIHDVPAFRLTLLGRPRRARVSFLYETIHGPRRSGLRWHPDVHR